MVDNLEEEILVKTKDACHEDKLLDECNLQDYTLEDTEEVVDCNPEDNLVKVVRGDHSLVGVDQGQCEYSAEG